MKLPQKKRRHHYVWRHYLEAWATAGKLWCIRRGGHPFHVSTRNVAVETDFYRLKELTSQDLEFVQMVINSMENPLVRRLAERWIPMFTEAHELQRQVEALGDVPQSVREAFDIALNNTEEDLHARIEGDTLPLLDSLREGQIDVLESDESFTMFALYLAAQLLRTRGMKQATVKRLQPIAQVYEVDVDASWGLVRTVLATGLSYNLSGRRTLMRATILKASTPAEFMAGDQPLFNVRGGGKEQETPPTELELYYPLSPSTALLLDFSPASAGVEKRVLGETEVGAYNRLVMQEAHEQVFASRREALEDGAGEF